MTAAYLLPRRYTSGVRTRILHLALLASFSPLVLAQAPPAIVAIQNNYSYTLPFSPNYGIAQGSIFVVIGSNLAPSATGLQSTYPLTAVLNGVSMNVTVGLTVTHPILYYVTPTQIAAILPSATPVGAGTLAITVNGLTSTAAIQVVQSNFGILTLNGAGSGPAAAFDATGNPLSPTHSAAPGSTITLWGSGAGPSTGDESNVQTPANLVNVPIEVDIGGISATVSYHGRSLYPGVDQINVVVPASVTPGCWVSVVVQSAGSVGNFATIPVAAGGGACSDLVTGLTSAQLQTLYAKGSFVVGNIAIGSYTVPPHKVGNNPVAATTSDNASVGFARFTSAAAFNQALLAPAAPTAVAAAAVSMGSCLVNQLGYINSQPSPPYAYLDAGPSIAVTGAAGTQTLMPVNNFYGSNVLGNSLNGAFIPASGDTFTFAESSGGQAVGPFTANVTVPSAFTWNERDTLTSVTRAQGVTVTWQNAAPNSFVQVAGMSSATFGLISLATSFTCTVPAAGTFTVPSSVTLSLPPTASGDGIVSPAFLAVGDYTYPQPFTAAGVDFAAAFGYVVQSTSPTLGFIYK